jgi:uncharacterized membrane protein YgcG
MKHPIYTVVTLLSCAYLVMANMSGWALFQSSANRSNLSSPSFSSSSGGGGWSFGGGHK